MSLPSARTVIARETPESVSVVRLGCRPDQQKQQIQAFLDYVTKCISQYVFSYDIKIKANTAPLYQRAKVWYSRVLDIYVAVGLMHETFT